MNGRVQLGGRRAPTQADMEVKYLRQEVKGLYQINESLKKKLSHFERLCGWDMFQESLSTLAEDHIDDAITALLAHRKKLRDKQELSQQNEVTRTEHQVIHSGRGVRFADNVAPNTDDGNLYTHNGVIYTSHGVQFADNIAPKTNDGNIDSGHGVHFADNVASNTDDGVLHTAHGVHFVVALKTDDGNLQSHNGVLQTDHAVSGAVDAALHTTHETLQADHRAIPTDLGARFVAENQSPAAAIPTQGMKRSSYSLPMIATAAQAEIRKQVRQRPSRQSLRPSLKRVGSARELATKFAALFKKGKKDKGKDRVDNVAEEEEEQDDSQRMIKDPLSQNRVAVETLEPSRKPFIRKIGNKMIIKGQHLNLLEWKLQLADEKVQLLQQQNETDSSSALDGAITKVNSHHSASFTTSTSQELEAGMVAAMEEELRIFPRLGGFVRSFRWQSGARPIEDFFYNSCKEEESGSQNSASQARERRSLPLAPAAVYVGPPGKNPNRYTQFCLLPRGDYSPPASPPPTKPLPAIPEATLPFPPPPTRPPPPPLVQEGEDGVFPPPPTRPPPPPPPPVQEGENGVSPTPPTRPPPPVQGGEDAVFPPPPTRPPPPPPVQEGEDDVFAPTGAPAPKVTLIGVAQQARHLYLIRRRNSEPSPTPRFIVHRPNSPSPGGNGSLGETPKLSWMSKEI